MDGETQAATGQLDQVKRIQRVVRLINMIAAGTGVGLILTFLIMNLQLIFGNGLGVPLVPKLEGPELVIVGILDLLMVLLVIIFLGVILLITGNLDSSEESTPTASPKSPEEAAPHQAPVGGARSM